MKRAKKALLYGMCSLFLLLPLSCTAYSAEVVVPLETLKVLRDNNLEALNEQKKYAQQLEKLDDLTRKQANTIAKQAELLTKADTQLTELERRQNETNKYFADLLNEQKKATTKAERQRNILAVLLGVLIIKNVK